MLGIVLFGDVVESRDDPEGSSAWLRILCGILEDRYAPADRLAGFGFTQGDELRTTALHRAILGTIAQSDSAENPGIHDGSVRSATIESLGGSTEHVQPPPEKGAQTKTPAQHL